MELFISKVDIASRENKEELIRYLAKDETKALFLIGNLISGKSSSFLYLAKQNGKIVGVCGYYPTFKSCSLYAETPEASKELVKEVLSNHMVSCLLGMKQMALPAYEEFLKRHMKVIKNPEKLFLELNIDDFKPYFTQDGIIEPIEKDDVDDAVRLHRLLHNTARDKPITEEEKLRIIECSVKFGLKINGQLVSMAMSNGLGIKAFQILGVTTEPNYRKKGYAKAVCSHLISYMRQKGASKAIIFTEEGNKAAIKCYSNLGFRIVDKYYLAVFEKKEVLKEIN